MNTNKKYKAVVIGCGKIGAEEWRYDKKIRPVTHAAAYKNHPKVELSGLVDINKAKLKTAGKSFPGIPLFVSAELMFKEIKPDIVSIATHSNSHLEFVKLAGKYKTKVIVCEKPISNTIKEAEEMIEICTKNKSLLIINHQRRFDPLLIKWQEKIKKGLIGDILQATCYYYNGLLNNGTHAIDLLRFFLGEVEWVSGIMNEKTTVFENDKNIDVIIGFKNGTRVVLQSLSKNYGFFNFCFYGTKGSFLIKNLGYAIEYCKLIKNKNYKNYYQLSEPIIKEGKIRSFMIPVVSYVVDSFLGKEKLLCQGEEGLASLKVILAIRESAENNGKIIKIK